MTLTMSMTKKEDQKEDIIDVNKLTEKQKARYLRDNKRVFFLKALSVDPYSDITKLAKKCKLQIEVRPKPVYKL